MDFKENLSLGHSVEEVSQDFYERPQRSYFTIVVYYEDPTTKIRTKKYFDFLSSILTHDTLFVTECLESVINSEEMKELNLKKLSFWLDNGPAHFRTFEFLGKLSELRKRYLISLNYFVEYHGKSSCDSHFSLVSRYYSRGTSVSARSVRSTEDLMELLREKFSTGKVNVSLQEYKREVNKTRDVTILRADNFSCFNYFEFEQREVVGRLEKGSEEMRWEVGRHLKKVQRDYHEKVGFHHVIQRGVGLLGFLKRRTEKSVKIQKAQRESRVSISRGYSNVWVFLPQI